MRPFDVEPNYYEDLMLSRNPNSFKQSNIDMDRQPVSSKKEFLKKTMTDKDYIHNYGKVVSASPYRAVVRRMDYSSMIDDASEFESGKKQDPDDDEFERDEAAKSFFNEPTKMGGLLGEISPSTTRNPF